MAKLIFGCGYLGLRVARLWKAAGEEVYAATRSSGRAEQLAAEGLRPVVADVTDENWRGEGLPPKLDTALFAVGYDRAAGLPIHSVYAGGLANVLTQLPAKTERVIYISSTGVYGDVAGERVDEDTPCRPTRDGGKASLAAEQLLQASPFTQRSIILRLAGIYGPGRIPRSADLLAGRPIDAPAAGWLNLIHVEDAARIVLLAAERAPLPSLYVVSDGQPVIRGYYYRELARLLGAPPPTFGSPAAESPAAQRAGSDKRIDPARLFSTLSPQLMFPSYREGLAAIVAAV
ncbi:MAG: SDR family oxidoreductase [Pirellulaceae bacterium]|nr:SDR family oxidoreductase [Pirellulaceae bacterium]